MSYIGNEPVVSATRTITEITATAGQTTFIANGGYTVGYLDVIVNGSQLQTTDFTATNGSTVVLNAAASAGDDIRLIALGTFNVSNLVSPNYTGTLTGGTGVVNLGSGQFYKDANGNVGIGVTPSAWGGGYKVTQVSNSALWASNNSLMHLTGNTYFDGTNYKYISTDYAQDYYQFGGSHVWRYAAIGTAGANVTFTEAMRITPEGNVGIGTSSPAVTLQLGGAFNKTMRIDSGTGNAGFFGVFNTFTILASNRSPTTGVFVDTGKASSSIFLDANVGDGNIRFNTTASNNTDPTERMRINSSGNLLVGKTTTNYTTIGISFSPNASSTFCTDQNTGNIQCVAPVNQSQIAFYRYDTGALMGYIINGASNSVSYATSSDYRLKENIAPMQGALDVVAQLKPVTYNWKADGSAGQGFIAHELQEVVPDCVTGEKDAVDAEGKPIYQGIDTSFLVATLTAAIKEQQAMIEELKAKVAALEAA